MTIRETYPSYDQQKSLKMESSTEDLSKDSQTIEEPWRTFTLTHVDYPAGDVIGKILAIISLLPLVIVIIFITLS